jgi:hypothetical protein
MLHDLSARLITSLDKQVEVRETQNHRTSTIETVGTFLTCPFLEKNQNVIDVSDRNKSKKVV